MIVKNNKIQFENLFSTANKFNSDNVKSPVVTSTDTQKSVGAFPESNAKGSFSQYDTIEKLYDSSRESAKNYNFLK